MKNLEVRLIDQTAKFPVETKYKWYDISNLSEEDSDKLQDEFNFTLI